MIISRGQAAVVTGAASGIGLALATALLQRGVNVVLADVEPAALEINRPPKQDGHGEVVLSVVDVSRADDVARLKETALDAFGRIDLVVNNAGVHVPMRRTTDLSVDDWQWVLGVNMWGVIHGVQTFLPHLVEQRSGHLVNTASMVGISNVPYISPYSASKHAVVGLTEALAIEMQELGTGVNVSVLCPGAVTTGIVHAERNRPSRLERTHHDPEPVPQASLPDPTPEQTLAPAQVAEITLKGIEADALHIIPNLGSGDRVRSRVERLIRDLPD